MWIARDKDGTIRLFKSKPYRNTKWWDCENEYWHSDDLTYIEIPSDWDIFTNITWVDNPIEVELTLKERPIKFSLSEETKKMIEKNTGKTVEELKNCPLSHW